MLKKTISYYKIIEKIGQGGMGIVYKAIDIRLNRIVALKILPSPLSLNEKKRQRFIHEAQAESAINHPNICQVYDIGHENDVDYIVMEYVEGETLRQLIDTKGKLTENEVIKIGIEICSAVQAAHEKGIIHRDIKPDNIMITRQGSVKIMDFGLAKLKRETQPLEPSEINIEKGTSLSLLTSLSTLMGTVFYMSPEQIEKGEIDERTDIFSLGIVLYEMITGQQPFSGLDNLAIMEAILEKEPVPPSALVQVSQKMENIILKALAKEPVNRFPNIKDLREKLEELSNIQINRETKKKKVLTRGFVSLAILLIGFVGLRLYFQSKTTKIRLYPVLNSAAMEVSPVFSPDGKRILYRYYTNSLRTGGSFINIYNMSDESEKTWHFQGEPLDWVDNHILFSRLDKGLFVTDSTFSFDERIADFGRWAHFSPDGKQIVFSRTITGMIGARNDIYLYDFNSRKIEKISPDNGLLYSDPSWSPDGRRIFCVGGEGSVYELWSIDIRTRQVHQISNFGCWIKNPIVSRSLNKLYFLSDKTGGFDIWSVDLNASDGQIDGFPKQITPGLNVAMMDIDTKGQKIIFENDKIVSTINWTTFAQLNEQNLGGRNLPEKYENIESIRLSPDKSRLLIETADKGARCMVIKSLKDNSEIVLGKGLKPFAPSWSADGKWIVYDAGGGDNADIWRIPATGGKPEIVIEHPGADWMPTYSPDGDKLCFVSNRLNNQFDLWIKDFVTGKIYPITNTPEHESRGFWSHKGDLLAYFSIDKARRSASICVYNFETGKTSTIMTYHPPVPYAITLISWKKDDMALYIVKDTVGCAKLLMEIPISGGSPKILGQFRWEEISTIDVCGDTLYFVSANHGADIWMLELE